MVAPAYTKSNADNVMPSRVMLNTDNVGSACKKLCRDNDRLNCVWDGADKVKSKRASP